MADADKNEYKETLEEIKGMVDSIIRTPISERSIDIYSVTLTRIYNLCLGVLNKKKG